MKKLLTVLSAIMLLTVCAFSLTGCFGSTTTTESTKITSAGYYQYTTLNPNPTDKGDFYFTKLDVASETKSWADNIGLKGKIYVDGTNLTLYLGNMIYMTGTYDATEKIFTVTTEDGNAPIVAGTTFKYVEPTSSGCQSGNWSTYVILGVLIVGLIVYFVFSSVKNKKKAKETQNQMNTLGVGDEIMTIGGIYGKIVHTEENAVVIETGTEGNKSYTKIDKRAINSVLNTVKKTDEYTLNGESENKTE